MTNLPPASLLPQFHSLHFFCKSQGQFAIFGSIWYFCAFYMHKINGKNGTKSSYFSNKSFSEKKKKNRYVSEAVTKKKFWTFNKFWIQNAEFSLPLIQCVALVFFALFSSLPCWEKGTLNGNVCSKESFLVFFSFNRTKDTQRETRQLWSSISPQEMNYSRVVALSREMVLVRDTMVQKVLLPAQWVMNQWNLLNSLSGYSKLSLLYPRQRKVPINWIETIQSMQIDVGGNLLSFATQVTAKASLASWKLNVSSFGLAKMIWSIVIDWFLLLFLFTCQGWICSFHYKNKLQGRRDWVLANCSKVRSFAWSCQADSWESPEQSQLWIHNESMLTRCTILYFHEKKKNQTNKQKEGTKYLMRFRSLALCHFWVWILPETVFWVYLRQCFVFIHDLCLS